MLGCKHKTPESNEVSFNQDLADELQTMSVIDQIAANNAFPPSNYSSLSQEEWEVFKDSVYRTNQKRAKEIFDTYGFVGFDLAGKEGSKNFWLIVQHSDHNPKFQNEVLEKMKVQVDIKNAESRKYGLLVDRMNLNTGKAQIYGTQVTYNMNTGQAYPKKLADSTNVNKRRKSIGLEPIEIYLNDMSEMHFEMNKENYLKKGVTEPYLYKTK
tara:strand:- start:193 stop:828 length:636 start_codon:yes stop_codon:yes gene_type:complete